MVSSTSNTYVYNGTKYRQRSEQEAQLGYLAATVASGLVMAALPSFSNPFLKQMKKEHGNNELYKDAFIKSIEISKLENEGLRLVNTTFKDLNEQKLYEAGKKIADGDIKAGLNACYIPDAKIIKLNANKATISGYHELGHAMNHLKSRFGRILQKLRVPGYTIAGLMGTLALFSRPKPKEAKRNIEDFILDNCGTIAFISMLPTVAEEALASHNGIKLAKQAGLSDNLVKNLRKFYGKALLSYVGYAVLTGISVYTMSKITQLFTRPQKIEQRETYY